MALKSLRDLYIEELRELYSAEHQNLQALQKMVIVANQPQLKTVLMKHMDQTREQIQRLDRIFEQLGVRSRGRTCVGMHGLIKESRERLKQKKNPAVLDAGLISAAQRVEHYEMAAYESAHMLSERLGFSDAADALERTIEEEEDADRELSVIALTMVDPQADPSTPRYGPGYYRDQGIQEGPIPPAG